MAGIHTCDLPDDQRWHRVRNEQVGSYGCPGCGQYWVVSQKSLATSATPRRVGQALPALRRRRAGMATAALAVLLVAGAVCCSEPLRAQQMVIDWTSISYQIQQLNEARSQLAKLEEQVSAAQKLNGGMMKLTNMGDVASLLNNPQIRRALPGNFSAFEQLLTGQGTGATGAAQQGYLAGNTYYSTPGNDFYAGELRKSAHRSAGYETVGQQMYDAAGARMEGIDQLRQQINTSPDPKTTMDLQARLQAETAFMAADQLRMQALQTVQQAQLDTQKQRDGERWRQRLDDMDDQTSR